jgi:hypothetical protein
MRYVPAGWFGGSSRERAGASARCSQQASAGQCSQQIQARSDWPGQLLTQQIQARSDWPGQLLTRQAGRHRETLHATATLHVAGVAASRDARGAACGPCRESRSDFI